MSMLQNDKVIFYHPCNDETEFTQAADWTETTPAYPSGKVSNAFAAAPSDSVGSFGSAFDFLVGTVYLGRAVPLSSTKFVVAYRSASPSNKGKARVGTVSGTDITFGAEAEFLSSEPSNPPELALVSLSATEVIVVYNDFSNGAAKVGTISGTDITFGSARVFNSGGALGGTDIAKLDSSKVVVSYTSGSSNGSAKIGTVSGTDITFGSATVFRATNTGVQTIAILSSTSFAIAYREIVAAGDGYARIGTVSGTDITFGTEVAIGTVLPGNDRILDSVGFSATQFVVVYRNSSNLGKAKVGTVSGTDITWGTEAEFLGSVGPDNFEVEKINSSQFLLSYQDNLNAGQTKIGTVSGTTLTFGSATQHQGTSGSRHNSPALLDSTTFVITYKDNSDSDGTAKVGTLASPAGSLENGPSGFSSGSAAEFLAADGTGETAISALNATKFVVAYRDGADSSHGTAKIGTVAGTDITFGAETEFLSAGAAYYPCVATLSATKFVVAYNDGADSSHGTAKIGTVAGTDITFGAEAEFLSANGAFSISVTALSATGFVVVYRDNSDSGHGTAKVGTVAGTDITFGAEHEFNSAAGGADWVSASALNATKFVVAYKDGADSNHGTAKVGIVSGTDITFGAETEFLSGNGAARTIAVALSETKFVVAYRDGTDSNHGTAKVGTVSGTDITFGAEAEFKSDGQADPLTIAAMGPATVIVAWADTGGNGVAKVGTVSGADITFGSADTFNTGGTDATAFASHPGPLPPASATDKAVVTFSDGGDSNHGKSVVYQNVADPYPTVASETKVAFCGWFSKPS